MTYAEALKALTPPLVFWGEEQLAAVKFLEEVEEVVELLREEPEAHRCEVCRGMGCHCGECDGTGILGGDELRADLSRYRDDVVAAGWKIVG